MIIETHNHLGRSVWYITSPAVEQHGYRPGRVNSVWMREVDSGWFRVYYTDGYKEQLLGDVQGRENAIAAMGRAIAEGAGGGFTSRFEPN